MRKRIIASMAIVAIFALAIAAYAYTRGATTASTAACCCMKSGDSCPMKSKGHEEKGEHAKMSCCKKHDAEHSKADGHECCGDSCPMKKKDGATAVSSEKASCCDDCACCSTTSA